MVAPIPNHDPPSDPPVTLFATTFAGIANESVVTVSFKDGQKGSRVTVGIPRELAEQLALHILTTHHAPESLAFQYRKIIACKLA